MCEGLVSAVRSIGPLSASYFCIEAPETDQKPSPFGVSFPRGCYIELSQNKLICRTIQVWDPLY